MVAPEFRDILTAMRCAPLLLFAAACGSGTVTSAGFPGAFARAVCQVQAKCRAEAGYLEQQCETDAASLYAPDLSKALAAGKSAFDPQQAQICLDGLRARGCERTAPEVDQACERTVTGTVAQGVACSWVFECATGRCEPDGPGACPAKCGAVSAEGASCAAAPCDLRAGLRCINNVCAKLHAVDQKCSSSSDCAAGLFCDGLGKCALRAAAQASCDSGEQCAAGLFCDTAPNGGLCRKQSGNGATCTAASADAIRFACEGGQICKGFKFAKTGATPGICAPLGEVGASCVALAQVTGCGDGLVCAGSICKDKPVSGPCAQDGDCKNGVAFCDGTQCNLLKSAGVACAGSTECASRFCEPSTGKCADSNGACHEP